MCQLCEGNVNEKDAAKRILSMLEEAGTKTAVDLDTIDAALLVAQETVNQYAEGTDERRLAGAKALLTMVRFHRQQIQQSDQMLSMIRQTLGKAYEAQFHEPPAPSGLMH